MSTEQEPRRSELRAFRRSLRALELEAELSLLSQTECCGVTRAQCHILLEVESLGKASIGELAEALELDPSTLSRTVDSLVKAGLVSRVDDPSNRRRQIVELLPPGRAKVEYINLVCDEYYEKVLTGAEAPGRREIAAAVTFLADALRRMRLGGGSCRPEPGKSEA
jgi:DNA-binding MarR family transcriptional regulator